MNLRLWIEDAKRRRKEPLRYRRLTALFNAARHPKQTYRSLVPAQKFLLAAWTLVAVLFAAVTHFTTGTAWTICVALAMVMAGFSGFISAAMCRWSDERNIARTRLIIFFGVGLALMFLSVYVRGSRFDPTSIKLFVFSFSGMIINSFFMPKYEPSPKPCR